MDLHTEPSSAEPELRTRDSAPAVIAEIGRKGDLPAAARAIQRLHLIRQKENTTTLVLARAILQDAGLCAKVLKVVNSAFYRARGGRVSTISRAIVLLGFDTICELATGLLLLEQFLREGDGNAPLLEQLRRSQRCALLSQALAERVGQCVPEEAYLFGMFANLGQMWVAAYYPDSFGRALAAARRGVAPDDAVAAQLGVAPAALTAEILEHWGLPPGYASHFRLRLPIEQRTTCPPPERLAAIVDIADGIAASYGRPDAAAVMATLAAQSERLLGLPAAEFREVVERVEVAVRAQVAALAIGAAAHADLAGEAKATGVASARASDPNGHAPTEAESDRRGTPSEAGDPRVAHATPLEGSEARDRAGSPAQPSGGETSLGLALLAGAGAIPESETSVALEIAAEVARAIVERDEINHILATVLEGISRGGRFDAVVLALVDHRRHRLVGRLGYGPGVEEGLHELVVPLDVASGALAEAALLRTTRVVEAGSAEQLVPPGAPVPLIPARSFIVQPLVVRDRTIGVLLAARGDRVVGESDAGVVQLFASLTLLAFDGATASLPAPPAAR